MNKKRNLFDELDIKGCSDNSSGTLDISVERIKDMVNNRIDSASTERMLRPMKSKKKIALIAVAATLVMGITVFAASGLITSWFSSSSGIPDYNSLPSAEQVKKDIGHDAVLIESFENGYAFDNGNIINNNLTDENNKSVEKFKSVMFRYEKDGDVVNFSQDKYDSDMETVGDVVDTVDGVDILYHSYTNKLIFGRYKVDKIRGKTSTRVPRDKWIIVENAHEAIVSDELFNKTKSKECKPRKGVELGTTLFSGKVVCGCCGRSLYTWSKNHVLFCQTPTLSDDNPGCYDKKIHEDELIALVYDAIKFASFNSKEKIAKFKNDVAATTNELGSVKREIQNEVGRLDRLKLKKEKLFQKLMDNQMSDDEYMKLSDEVEREQIAVEDKIRELKKKQKTVLAKKKEKETTVKTYKEIGAIKKIDRNVVDKFINKMIVSKEGRVELEWNFKNIFVC